MGGKSTPFLLFLFSFVEKSKAQTGCDNGAQFYPHTLMFKLLSVFCLYISSTYVYTV